ncbi:MAG: hypothetical protein ACXWQO_10570 [Bdellovibrionota bacterium]
MIRITLLDGTVSEIARGDTRGVIPFANVLSSPMLRAPIEGIVCHKGKALPLLGPLPKAEDLTAEINDRAWIILFADHAQVIRGLPDFGSAAAKILPFEENKTSLLKSA